MTCRVAVESEDNFCIVGFVIHQDSTQHFDMLVRVVHREREQQRRARGESTVPSTIGIEKQTNPFLRCREPSVVQTLQAEGRLTGEDPIAAFAALREWKNDFR